MDWDLLRSFGIPIASGVIGAIAGYFAARIGIEKELAKVKADHAKLEERVQGLRELISNQAQNHESTIARTKELLTVTFEKRLLETRADGNAGSDPGTKGQA